MKLAWHLPCNGAVSSFDVDGIRLIASPPFPPLALAAELISHHLQFGINGRDTVKILNRLQGALGMLPSAVDISYTNLFLRLTLSTVTGRLNRSLGVINLPGSSYSTLLYKIYIKSSGGISANHGGTGAGALQLWASNT